MAAHGWVGVDLDGTLAEYDGWKGEEHIGAPVPLMVERVKAWLAEGREVKIFTARVANDTGRIAGIIEAWCLEHVGQALPVTHKKDYGMVELWDDRAVQVIPNTGERADSREHYGVDGPNLLAGSFNISSGFERETFEIVLEQSLERLRAGLLDLYAKERA